MSELKEYITIIRDIDSTKMINIPAEKLSEVEGTSFKDGDIMLFFANLNLDQEAFKKINDSLIQFGDWDAITYLQCKHDELCTKYSDVIADVLMVDTFKKYSKKKKNAPVTKVATELQEALKELCGMAQTSCELALSANEMAENGRDQYFYYVIAFQGIGSFNFDVHYSVWPAYINEKLKFYDLYNIGSTNAALWFDLANVAKEKIIIKKCNNCSKYFRPISRSDEIYCNNVFRKGKTCRELSYEIKISKDQALNEYRKIYKTQNARKQRNSHVPQISERFREWSVSAQSVLKQCQDGEISIEDMTNIISKSDWMKGGELNA